MAEIFNWFDGLSNETYFYGAMIVLILVLAIEYRPYLKSWFLKSKGGERR